MVLNFQTRLTCLVSFFCRFCATFSVANCANALSFAAPCLRLVVGMTFRTRGFLAIQIATGHAIFERILSCCDALQMLWVDAISIAARVVDDMTILNFTKHAVPGNAVRAPARTTEKEYSVTIPIKRLIPKPAFARHVVFTFESLRFLFREVFHNSSLTNGAKGANGSLA